MSAKCLKEGIADKIHAVAASGKPRLSQLLALATLGVIMASSAPAEARGEGLSGSWSGGGWVSFASGERERARCRAHYSPRSAASYTVNATCATASGSASQSAFLRKVGANSYAGSFYNSQFGVSGNIFVVLHGNTQSVRLTSQSGAASLSFSR